MPFVLLLGEDEIAERLVSLKDMTSGEQQKVSAAEAAQKIRAAVDARNAKPVIAE